MILRLPGVILIVCILLGGVEARQTAYGARRIVINIPEFALYVIEDEQVTHEYSVAIGDTLRPSLLGETEIINRVYHPTYYPSDGEPIPPGPDNPVGTRWLGLGFPGYGIHGTNQPDSIGRAVSAGCIRMHNRDVEELTELVWVGTPVSLTYETIVLDYDPDTGLPQVLVLPDIYGKGTNTWERFQEKADAAGWSGYDRVTVRRWLDQAAGRPLLLLGVQVAEARDEHGYWVPVKTVEERFQAQWDDDDKALVFEDGYTIQGQQIDGDYFIPDYLMQWLRTRASVETDRQ